MNKKIAVTCGDPQGIGPEIINKLLQSGALDEACEQMQIFLYASEDLINLPRSLKNKIQIVSLNNSIEDPGKHSFRYLEFAAKDCLNGKYDGLVTGPISKERWAQAGHRWKGQTEYLGNLCKTSPEMLFVAADWRVMLVTRHVALKDVPAALSFKRMQEGVKTLRKFLQDKLKIIKPKIAIAGLNPHAGENGEIGTEEKEYLKNWCEQLGVEGPFSPDHIWVSSANDYLKSKKQHFDAYLAPYHDQVLPLIKTVTSFKAVNTSIGLPFVRTSPDHGTAFDLVGTGKADEKPFLEAIKLCGELTNY